VEVAERECGAPVLVASNCNDWPDAGDLTEVSGTWRASRRAVLLEN
jgi:hypothetical protein